MPASEYTPLVGSRPHVTRHASADSDNSARNRIRGLLSRVKSRLPEGKNTPRLDRVLEDLDDDERQSKRFFWFAIFCIINHVFGGAITLHFLEGWSLYDSFYFCVVTTTTVGYGDITPTRTASKIYVIYYVIVSIGLISALLSYLVSVFLDRQEELLMTAITGEAPEELDDYDSDLESPRSETEVNSRILHATKRLDISDYYGLFYSTMTLFVVILVGTAIFGKLENLSGVDAVYATVISATTVGFGDFEPTKNLTKMTMTVWLCFSTICVAKVVADFTDANMKAKQRGMTRRLLTASMDLDSLKRMDADKSGSIDKSEFLTEMLVRTGKVERKEIETILLRFAQLDRNGSGQITPGECM